MHYVAGWQMQTALTWLKDDDLSLGEVASRLGYDSEAAFSRAFKRIIGVSPGVVRRQNTESGSSGSWRTQRIQTLCGQRKQRCLLFR
jgi:AraC-like DNA-binding protein